MTTLRDIAQHFGLSESTVSRILTDKGRLSAETRRRVREYAAAVDYHPNQLAKSLKRQRSNTVGVLLPDITNEYCAVLFKAIEDRLRGHGLTAVLFNTNEAKEREEGCLAYLHSAQVDGMIVATAANRGLQAADGILARMPPLILAVLLHRSLVGGLLGDAMEQF